MKTICVVTGTRAEYGLLQPLLKKIVGSSNFKLLLIVTGMHLCPEFGLTYKEIEQDGYTIAEKIDVVLSSDSPSALTKSIGLALISFSDYFRKNKPDMLVVLGDRYEIFAVATAAAIAQIPIAHISGGDTTEGAVDEFFRHSITKMSYLHFATTEVARKRVIQLGEYPERVFNFGSLGIENIQNIPLLSKSELEKEIDFSLESTYAVVTFHPVTMEKLTAENQLNELLYAIKQHTQMRFIITMANSDSSGRIINSILTDFVTSNAQCKLFASLGTLKYLSAVKYAQMVIGNSSSGICEVPSFGIPTINIGDRQKGRLQAQSVINCKPNRIDIANAVEKALKTDCSKVQNPYEGVQTSTNILSTIEDFLLNNKVNLKKKFYNMKF